MCVGVCVCGLRLLSLAAAPPKRGEKEEKKLKAKTSSVRLAAC